MSLATAARSDVDRILADRERRAGRGLNGASVAAAVGLHGLVVAVALLLPHLQPPPKQLEFVPVTVIPAQALGVRRPAPPKKSAPKPAEAPAAEAPEEAPAKPEPPKPDPKPEPKSEAPVLPEKTDPKKKPEPPKPAKPDTKPDTPSTPGGKKPEAGKPAATAPAGPGSPNGKPNSPPNATAVGETGDQAGRRGAPTGSPLGTTAFGSQIAGLDNPDFTYGYYLDRLLSLIDANWVRPSMGSGVRAIVSFRIQRDGSLAESSGYNSFDLAALRAVQNAAPFPPLPRPYRGDDLGVNLVVY
jgi:TonB family protein